MTRFTDRLLLLLAIVLVWFAASAYAGEIAITPPLQTFRYLISLVSTASFWGHVGATLLAFLAALVISIVGGVLLGLIFGLRRFAGDVAEPIIASLYTIPKVTLYPIMLLVFGLGMPAKIAFGVIHGLVPVLLFTLAAVKNLSPTLWRTARALRLTPMQTVMTVLAPAVRPEIVSGVRVGFALTLLGVLIGEMFASQRGLGFLIINGINIHNVPMTTSVAVLVVTFAVLANSAMMALDRRAHHVR